MNSAVKRRGASRFPATRELQLGSSLRALTKYAAGNISSERAILENNREHSAIDYRDRTKLGNFLYNTIRNLYQDGKRSEKRDLWVYISIDLAMS